MCRKAQKGVETWGRTSKEKIAAGAFTRERMVYITPDMPIKPEEPIVVEQTIWRRSTVLRNQVLAAADYKCEINGSHETFIAEKTGLEVKEIK